MKKLISILLCLCMIFALTGCGSSTEEEEENVIGKRLEVVHSESHAPAHLSIVVDKETGVAYLWCGVGYKGGLTVMLDSEGKPLIWGEEKQEVPDEEQM